MSLTVCTAFTLTLMVTGFGYGFATTGDFYGNEVKLRTLNLPTGARKYFMDYEVELPPGTLMAYQFFAHNMSLLLTTTLRLQIWRPQGYTQFTLVWEKIVVADLSSRVGILYTFELSPSERFQTQQSDRIGFTNENNFGAICANFVEGHRTFFGSVVGDAFPVVDQSYYFDNINVPLTYSVGVYIIPSLTTPSEDVPTPDLTTPSEGVSSPGLTTPSEDVPTPGLTTPSEDVSSPAVPTTASEEDLSTPGLTTPSEGVSTPDASAPNEFGVPSIDAAASKPTARAVVWCSVVATLAYLSLI